MLDNKYNIALIGMPGSGKSTIGKILAERLKLKFIDLDKYIEKKEGITINEIFGKGEGYFRDLESRYIKNMENVENCVIATGGGVVLREDNIKNLKTNSIVIFLDRPLNKIIDNIDTTTRPLLKDGKDKLHQIYKSRYSLYKNYSDFIIKNEQLNNTINLIVNYIESRTI